MDELGRRLGLRERLGDGRLHDLALTQMYHAAFQRQQAGRRTAILSFDATT